MKNITSYLSNSFKSIVMLLAASLSFVLIITLFPLFGSLFVKGFSIGNVLMDNLKLLLMLSMVSVALGFFLGGLASALSKNRMFWMILGGFLFYWLMIVLVILLMSGFAVSGRDFPEIFILSVWAMVAYAVFAVPLVIFVIFFIEKWTRK